MRLIKFASLITQTDFSGKEELIDYILAIFWMGAFQSREGVPIRKVPVFVWKHNILR